VHGIIAGTTGSGKSELLQTLIVALAVEHDPRVLNFVLIDYKGGATIEPFRKLPHVVEMASNLQPNSVERVFVAVKAEIDRRSAVLAEAGVSDLVDYRRNIAPNLRPDSTLPHEFPHLLIIVDEFAEMLQANPDYRVQFEQITRLGRAVGVSLLLATQKPAGVVSDQMRANMKLRIALRVESPEDSREILRRSDAAHLPHIAGRGYIQTGTDAITEIQIAWAGMNYTGARDSRYSRDEVASILETSTPPRSALTWLVAAMALEAQRASIPPQRAPWPPPLPHKLHFHDSLDTTYIHDTNNATASLEPARRSHGHHSGLPAADREAEGSPMFTDGRSTGSLHPWITGSTDVLHEQWQPHPWTTPLNLKIPVGLADDPETACQRIVYVDPMTDPVIVFGASGRGKTSFLRSFTLALAARYSPQDLNIYAIDFGKGGLRFLRSLPHCGAVVESASNEKLESLFRMLHGLLRDRQDKLRVTASIEEYNCSKSGQPDKLFPAILVIIDNLAEFKDEYERLLPDLIALVRDGRALGMYFLFSATRPSDLPAKLAGLMNQRFSMYQPNPEIYSDIFGRRTSALQDIPGRGFAYIEDRILQFQTVVPAIPALKGKADPVSILAQEMEDEWSRRGGKRPSAEIPRTADFLEMYSQVLGRPVTRISDLHIHEQWMQSMEPAHQEWLEAPFGYVSNREVRRLVFSAKPGGDGVHGMGAGTTGSGKSELLQTIIASLAVRYDPRIVNFVLIDYKGGATIEPFRTLPHTVDLATNLEPAAVHRIFKSIRAELDRRAKILARAGVADLVEYRRRIIPHLTVNSDLPRSFPHLFVVVDEFAEMIQANPDYRALFEQLTRLGRSFGVSLLLATQRPTGVVSDQMKANMKFRLCLRVETSDDSREILGRTDAMSLPSIPGRGYLQVGGGTTAEFQAGYSGVQYDPGDDDPNFSRSEIMAAIQDRIAIADGDASAEPPRTLLAWLVGAMALEANRSNIPVQRKPWPNQLPATLPWDRAIDAQHIPGVKTDTIVIHPAFAAWSDGDASAWQALTATPSDPPPLRVAVGLLDQPSDAAQRALELDLSSDACLILGATGRGKTTLLKTLVLGLAATHRPDQLHLYGFDFGRGGLRALYTLPHTGGFVDSADSERVERLFGILSDIVAERQQLMQSFESFEHYNRANPGSQLARVVVIIDNVAEFRETYESRLAQLMAILREGRAFGVHFVITGSLISDVPIRLFNMLNQRITFYQTDPGDYATIFGKGCPRITDLPGRGIAMHPTKDSPIPLEFHAATPSIGDLQLVIDQMRVTWQSICESDPRMRSRTAQSIHPLPSIIPLVELLQDTPSSNTANNVPFGHNDRDRKPTLLELETKGPHLLVIGPPMSGKTTTVQTMVLAMAHTYSPQHTAFILIDAAETSRTFFNLADHRGRRIADLPHVLATISSPNEAVDVVRRLSSEFRDLPDITKQNSRSHPESTPPERRIVIVMDNFEDISNQLLTSFAELGKGRSLSFIAACGTGMQHNISNPLKRRIESARYSFVLQDPELVRSLGARPASLPSRELPAGRGWFIKGARPTLIQVATVLSDSDAHTNLGLLFDVIHDKWDEPATWTHPYDPAAEVSSQDANQTSQFKMTPDLNAIAYSNQESIDAKTAFLQLSASAQTTPLLSLDDIPAVSNLVSLEVELPSKETSKET
jgi:S-DNA-T family DNA segregation ATPase FtsK/SpoIIIE